MYQRTAIAVNLVRVLKIACRQHQRSFTTSSVLCRNRKDTQLKYSYYHATSDIPLLYKTVDECLQETAEKYPDRSAVIFCQENIRKTFRNLTDEAERLAAGLITIGICKGDRVGMWAPNIWEWILTQYALAKIGAILVTINPAYRVQELEYCLKQAGVKGIVCSQTFKTQDYYSMLSEVCPELEHSKPGNLHSQRLPDLKSIIVIGPGKFKGSYMFDDVMDMGNVDNNKQVLQISKSLQADETAIIQFTSGTTGFPKGVETTHYHMVNNTNITGRNLEYHKQHHTVCVPLPLYHVSGLLLGSLASVIHGVTCVFPSPSYEAESAMKAINTEKCTTLYGTPVMFIDILNHPNFDQYDMTSLRIGGMGAAPCPIEIMKEATEKMHLKELRVGYGLTEACMATQSIKGDPAELMVSTVGKPLENIEIKIVDPQTQSVVPVNHSGEICIKGPFVMNNYWNDEEKTKECIDKNRWFHTGDLGTMDENGYCKIVGRLKDTIIRGGENIHPAEIEQHLYKHPKIENIQVIGLPDERMGEEVCACIKLKDNETVTSEEIKEFCKGQIAHYKIPRYVEFVETFPFTVTLKVQKYILRADMEKKLGLTK